jgi:hypothetical protein
MNGLDDKACPPLWADNPIHKILDKSWIRIRRREAKALDVGGKRWFDLKQIVQNPTLGDPKAISKIYPRIVYMIIE